jgi:hypothetical protein
MAMRKIERKSPVFTILVCHIGPKSQNRDDYCVISWKMRGLF